MEQPCPVCPDKDVSGVHGCHLLREAHPFTAVGQGDVTVLKSCKELSLVCENALRLFAIHPSDHWHVPHRADQGLHWETVPQVDHAAPQGKDGVAEVRLNIAPLVGEEAGGTPPDGPPETQERVGVLLDQVIEGPHPRKQQLRYLSVGRHRFVRPPRVKEDYGTVPSARGVPSSEEGEEERPEVVVVRVVDVVADPRVVEVHSLVHHSTTCRRVQRGPRKRVRYGVVVAIVFGVLSECDVASKVLEYVGIDDQSSPVQPHRAECKVVGIELALRCVPLHLGAPSGDCPLSMHHATRSVLRSRQHHGVVTFIAVQQHEQLNHQLRDLVAGERKLPMRFPRAPPHLHCVLNGSVVHNPQPRQHVQALKPQLVLVLHT
eukprot:Sspe_Gene.38049::Locus_18349_Transcript_1_1_Confidence_1.000_Length_4327::g.38049::m.38049